MKITVVAVGKKMPDWINSGIREYTKRLSGECKLSIIEVAAERRGKTANPEKLLLTEAGRILAALPESPVYIALDEKGEHLSTEDLSIKMNTWLTDGLSPNLILGGADGLHPTIKASAGEIWSLSNLTLPHSLARIILVEQMYRAWTILKGHPYHRR